MYLPMVSSSLRMIVRRRMEQNGDEKSCDVRDDTLPPDWTWPR